ncbi:MAG: MBL fold metallo-hydrolase [Proteobacteria bacterium]|nr:MBL fold metallo-hydrolase [Pseudomonadota bacterium]
MVSVRWTGAAGLEFTYEGKTWLIDPYLSRVGKATVFFGRPHADREKITRYLETLPGKLQAVIVGHTHLDHALDVPEILIRFPVPLVGSESLEALMSLHGMPGKVTVCSERTRFDLPGGASVTMIPSLHGLVFFGRAPYVGEIRLGQRLPLKASHYRHGRVFIPRLEVGGKSFLHVGSANLIDEQIEGQTCDVLFLCLPGWKMISNYHGRILSRVKPKIVVPFHFDDFSAPLSKDFQAPSLPWRSEKLFLDRIAEEAPDARIIHPDLFKPLVF